MEVPHRYPYNPPLRFIVVSFGTGFLWIAADWFPYWLTGQHIPTGFSFWFSLIGLIPIALALAVSMFRISVKGYLLLDNDYIVVPIGLFQMETATIEYGSIVRVWRRYIPPYEYRFVLKIATEKQAFSILPDFLPDNESYRVLEEFLNRKLLENMDAKKSPRGLVSEKSRHL